MNGGVFKFFDFHSPWDRSSFVFLDDIRKISDACDLSNADAIFRIFLYTNATRNGSIFSIEGELFQSSSGGTGRDGFRQVLDHRYLRAVVGFFNSYLVHQAFHQFQSPAATTFVDRVWVYRLIS